jgi:hypothetical protein
VLASLEHWTAGAGRNPGHDCAGLAGLAGTRGSVGFELAGQRVTLRMDGTQMAVISHDGTLLRTLPCPVPPRERHRLRGARRAATAPALPAGPVTVQRRVSQRGQIMVATQRIQVGMIHARKIVTVTVSDHTFRLGIDGDTVATVPRTTAARSTDTRPTRPIGQTATGLPAHGAPGRMRP